MNLNIKTILGLANIYRYIHINWWMNYLTLKLKQFKQYYSKYLIVCLRLSTFWNAKKKKIIIFLVNAPLMYEMCIVSNKLKQQNEKQKMGVLSCIAQLHSVWYSLKETCGATKPCIITTECSYITSWKKQLAT